MYPLFWVELLNQIEVNRRTFSLSELSVILWVSAVKGCPAGFHCIEYLGIVLVSLVPRLSPLRVRVRVTPPFPLKCLGTKLAPAWV